MHAFTFPKYSPCTPLPSLKHDSNSDGLLLSTPFTFPKTPFKLQMNCSFARSSPSPKTLLTTPFKYKPTNCATDIISDQRFILGSSDWELDEFKLAEENKVESITSDKAATEKRLQESIEKNHAELATLKEYYTNALTAAKEAKSLAEARANDEARTELESHLREAEEREAMLVQTLEELRQTLSRKEQQAVIREDMLRRDIDDLHKRYQASERRCEELVMQVPESTRPLLRQIEAMQESTATKTKAWASVERSLNIRLQEAEAKAAAAEERERSVSDRLSQTLSRINVLEAELQDAGCWEDAATLATTHLRGTDYARVMQRWAGHVLDAEHDIWRALIMYVAAGSLQDALAVVREAHQPDTSAMFIIACREVHAEFIEGLDPKDESSALIKDKLLVLHGLDPQNEDVITVGELYTKYQQQLCMDSPPYSD